MELMLLLYSKDHIIEEKERIDLHKIEKENYYHQLVKQTYEFMKSNPAFCAVIDLCAQQTVSNTSITKANKDKLGNAPIDKFNKKLTVIADKFERGLLNRKKYFSLMRQLLLELLLDDNTTPEMAIIANSVALSIYYSGTFDMATTINDYVAVIIPLVKRSNRVSIVKVASILQQNSKAPPYTDLVLYIVTANYDKALEAFDKYSLDQNKYNTVVLINMVTLLIIQFIYYIITHNNDNIKLAYEVLNKFQLINNSVDTHDSNSELMLSLLIAYDCGLISKDDIETVIELVGSDSKLARVLLPTWICMKDPDSEAAQKIMAEPPLASLVNQVKDFVAVAKERSKSTVINKVRGRQ
jgi:hypothetical protein